MLKNFRMVALLIYLFADLKIASGFFCGFIISFLFIFYFLSRMTAACLDSLKFGPKRALCRYYTHPFEMTFSTNFYRTVLKLVIFVRNYSVILLET
jgi:hypothetical protein